MLRIKFQKLFDKLFNLFKPMIVTMPDGNVYLRRYFLLRTRWVQILLHHLCCSDPDLDLHDHPWWFVSLILRGGYTEHTLEGVFQRRAGQILFRPIGSPHRLELSQPAWTFVITGKSQREWGFVTPSGWESWEEHAKLKEAVRNPIEDS